MRGSRRRLLLAGVVATLVALGPIDLAAQGPFSAQIQAALRALGLLNNGYTNGQVPTWSSAAGKFNPGSGGGGGGTVTSVSVASANGFGGSVATPTTTPALSLTTSVNGLLSGNGTAVSAFAGIASCAANAFLSAISGAGVGTCTASSFLGTTTYYVCAKGAGGTCVYNGDGGTVANPSDANNCTAKATPCATLAGVRALMAGASLTGIVTIQLADTAGTGTDCYRPNGVIFDMPTTGGGTPYYNVYGVTVSTTDNYPSVYIFVQGNTTTRTNVKFNGGASCAATTSSAGAAMFFKGNSARVRGVEMDYYNGGAVECMTCNLWLEDVTTTSDLAGNSLVAEGYWHANIRVGGALTVTNSAALQVNFYSLLVPCTPLSCVTFVGSNADIISNQNSQVILQGGTYTFGGAGTYSAFNAIAGSQIFMNATTAAPVSLTFNGAGITELRASQGSRIDEECTSFQFTCTFTSLAARANASSDSHISFIGTSSADSASAATTNGCIMRSTFPTYNTQFCDQQVSGLYTGGAQPALSGCSFSAQHGGSIGGDFTSGTTGTCTVSITFPVASGRGWTCYAADLGHPVVFTQTTSANNSCTVSGTTTSGDVIHFLAIGY